MKHTPIPGKLGCLVNADEIAQAKWRPVWVALPPDLDRLFRAAPKLADAHRKNIVAAAYDQDESAVKLAVRLSAIEAEARDALADAGLEK